MNQLKCQAKFTAILLLALCFDLPAVLAGGGPENVLLVVNRNDQSSLLIANHYIQMRKIPAVNVLYLSTVPDEIVTDLDSFRNGVLRPVLEYIQTARLGGQIDYVVYSSGFPTAVKVPTHFQLVKQQIVAEAGPAQQQLLKIYTGQVSSTSLTYFAQAVMADQPGYMALDANLYYRRPASMIIMKPFLGETQSQYEQALDNLRQEKFDEALAGLNQLQREHGGQMAVNYQLARTYAKQGDAKAATEWLIRAVRTGWVYRSETLKDPAFEKVKQDSLFAGLLGRMPDVPFDFAPTMGFSSRLSWGPNGGVNGSTQQGANYLLSTMLGTTTQFGNSEQEILYYLQRSALADESQPRGTFYFTETADVRTRTRVPNYAVAIKNLEAMGEKCEIVKSPLPRNGQVNGAMLGAPNFQWSTAQSEILPGGIVDNLTSFGGRFDASGQTKLSEALRYGAAGSSGAVVEPYALQEKFPHPMLHVHYRRGSSLAEAFYLSVSGPFQLLIIGDALCRPWAEPGKVMVTGLADNDTVAGKVKASVSFESKAVGAGALELYLDGRLVSRSPKLDDIEFDSSQMPDGHHELRFVVIANDLIQNRYRKTISFRVNNQNDSATLTTAQPVYSIDDSIRFEASATAGQELTLFLNSEPLAKKEGKTATWDIPATRLGRGPVSLRVESRLESGKMIFSAPVVLQIDGPISDKTKG